jgi:anti-sigma factor RsiW
LSYKFEPEQCCEGPEMSKNKYDNRVLTQYLLGTLPEAETERFDELGFTDDEFAAELAIAENNLVDAFVTGELAASDIEQFKAHYLLSPLRREKVNIARSLQRFSAKAGSSAPVALDIKTPGETGGGFVAALRNLGPNFRALRWAAAATVLLLAVGGLFWLLNGALKPGDNDTVAKQNTPVRGGSPQPAAVPSPLPSPEVTLPALTPSPAVPEGSASPVEKPAQKKEKPIQTPGDNTPVKPEATPAVPQTSRSVFFALAAPLRGAGSPAVFTIPKTAGDVVVRLQIEQNDFPSYRVALSDNGSGGNLWTSGALKAHSGGPSSDVTVRFPSRLLRARDYSLVLSGINSSGEVEIVGSYPFRAVTK